MKFLSMRYSPYLAVVLAASLAHQPASADVILGNGSTTNQTIEQVLDAAPRIVRVEEDWDVLVAEPDPAANLPQICTVFGPTDPSFGTHVVFEMNHGTLPNFSEGGMQLQVWWSDYLIGYLGQFAPQELNIAQETIQYTTVTRIHDNKLRMFIKNGTSSTWGNFGENQSLYIWLWSYRDHLNPYDPFASIRNSRVTYGANRVSHFCRREIRFYDENGNLYAKDTQPYYVHRLANDPGLGAANNSGSSSPGSTGTGTTDASGTEGASSPVAQ